MTTTTDQPQSLTASAAPWSPTSPAALRERIAEQGTAKALTRGQVLDRALLRTLRHEG